MKTFAKFALVLASVFAIAACNKNTGANVDKTALEATIKTAQELLASATPADYPQEAIDLFTRTLSTIQGSVATADTQAKVDNLTANLLKAIADFEASAFGAIPAEALTFSLPFETLQAKTEGSNAWDVAYNNGPAVVFGAQAGKCELVAGRNGKGKALHVNNGAFAQITGFNTEALGGKYISVSAWVKADKMYPHNYIISCNSWHTWKLQVQEAGKPFWTYHATAGIADMDNETDGSIVADAWRHIVISTNCETGVVAMYVNGELTKLWEGKPTGTIEFQEDNYLLVGAADLATAETETEPANWACFYGAIDELKVFNIALTEGQVSKLYRDEK